MRKIESCAVALLALNFNTQVAGGDMRRRAARPLIGKWRINEMELWDKDSLDMIEPADIQRGFRGHKQ
jgi:hypothetical protein